MMGKSTFFLWTPFTFIPRARLQGSTWYPNDDCTDRVRWNKRQILSLPKCLRSLSLNADRPGPSLITACCLLLTGEFSKHKCLQCPSGSQSVPGKGMILHWKSIARFWPNFQLRLPQRRAFEKTNPFLLTWKYIQQIKTLNLNPDKYKISTIHSTNSSTPQVACWDPWVIYVSSNRTPPSRLRQANSWDLLSGYTLSQWGISRKMQRGHYISSKEVLFEANIFLCVLKFTFDEFYFFLSLLMSSYEQRTHVFQI